MGSNDKPRTGHRIEKSTHDWLIKHFSSLSFGAEWTTEWAVAAMQESLRALRGRFSADELSALIELTKDLDLKPSQVGPQYLSFFFQEGCRLHRLDERFGVDSVKLGAQLNELAHAESAALQVWAAAYWRAGHHKSTEPEAYIKQMLQDPGIRPITRVVRGPKGKVGKVGTFVMQPPARDEEVE